MKACHPMKKFAVLLLILLLLALYSWHVERPATEDRENEEKTIPFVQTIPRLIINHDEDGDGIKDLEDILLGAREDVQNKPRYRSAYYAGGYPPPHEGVCTDVIWRALAHAGYNLKELIDTDIRNNLEQYPRVGGQPEPNIDFRRVLNLIVFFERHGTVLTNDLIPYDIENVKEWQGGDIVAFGHPTPHIGIVSNHRRPDGIPYMIHNAGPYTREEDAILYWHENISNIVGHYRWPRVDEDSSVWIVD